MSVTYDQMSALSMAFQEAHIPADRRRSHRIKQRIAAEITEWTNGAPGRTFGVMIEDFSTSGVGMVHSGRLKAGNTYTLEIPRPGHPPIRVILTVVRCDQADAGQFTTRMEVSEILAGRNQNQNTRRLFRPLVALFGAVAFGIALAYYLGYLS